MGDHGRIPAFTRYDGPSYRIIKKLARENRLSLNIDIYVISAKYGLINSSYSIDKYNRKMTPARAIKLRPKILQVICNLFENNLFDDVFINMGKLYLLSIEGIENILPEGTRLIYAKGRIGQKNSQMKKWLLEKNEYS